MELEGCPRHRGNPAFEPGERPGIQWSRAQDLHSGEQGEGVDALRDGIQVVRFHAGVVRQTAERQAAGQRSAAMTIGRQGPGTRTHLASPAMAAAAAVAGAIADLRKLAS